MIGLLSLEECNTLIDYHNNYGKMNITEYPHNHGIYKSRLNYNVSLVTRDSETQWVYDKLSKFLDDKYPNNNIDKLEFLYLHEFTEGMKFTKHIDRDRDCSWYMIIGATLNDGFVGGELVLYEPNNVIAKNVGEVYIMNSMRPHEVTEVVSGIRYSFVIFLTKHDLGISKTLL